MNENLKQDILNAIIAKGIEEILAHQDKLTFEELGIIATISKANKLNQIKFEPKNDEIYHNTKKQD